jgi:hypothetical protein
VPTDVPMPEAKTRTSLAVIGNGPSATPTSSLLDSSGDVTLTNVTLNIPGAGSSPGACPAVTDGQVFTLVHSGGSLTGTFNGQPDGSTITMTWPRQYPASPADQLHGQ